MKIVAASGYFDPIHVGHIEYLKLAASLGDELVVIVNNDEQAILKKGKPFMPAKDREAIIKCLRFVDRVFISIDTDKTVCKTLELIHPNIFAKGGDTFTSTIPEKVICDKLNIQIIDSLGDKIRSSSKFIADSKNE